MPKSKARRPSSRALAVDVRNGICIERGRTRQDESMAASFMAVFSARDCWIVRSRCRKRALGVALSSRELTRAHMAQIEAVGYCLDNRAKWLAGQSTPRSRNVNYPPMNGRASGPKLEAQ